jgi:Phage integrase family
MSSEWRFLVIRSGLPHVRFHDLRHAHATLLLCQGGVHPKVVSERLGHATVGITLDIYSHVIPGMQEEAARAFDELFPEAVSESVRDWDRSEAHLRWARTSMEATIVALRAARPASHEEAEDLAWALGVARERLAHLGLRRPT